MDDDQRLYALREGALDALVRQPEIIAAFKAWDVQLGVSAKARRSIAGAEAEETFQSAVAGPDLWDGRLPREADGVLHDIGLEDRGARELLAFGLMDRFIRLAAAQGGRALPESAPDFSPRIGRRFQIVIPAYWPTWYARERFEAFRTEIEEALSAAQKRGPGRPASATVAENRRDGEWWLLVEIRRAKSSELAAEYHRALGAKHAEEQGEPVCYNCIRHVNRRLAAARQLIAEVG